LAAEPIIIVEQYVPIVIMPTVLHALQEVDEIGGAPTESESPE